MRIPDTRIFLSLLGVPADWPMDVIMSLCRQHEADPLGFFETVLRIKASDV